MLRPEPTLVLSPLIALMKDQVDKLPAADRGDRDVRQLVARGRGDGRSASRMSPRAHAPPLRGAGAAPQRVVRRDAPLDRRRPRRHRRGALREHVGPRLPARLPLHPPRARGARRPGGARDDGDRDAGDGSGDRRRARSRARGRANERRAAEPALRRRGGRPATRTGCGSSSSGSRALAERQRDRLRALARLVRARSLARLRGPRASRSSTTTPASRPTSARASRTTSSRAGSRASSPRPRSAWASTSPTCDSSASSTTRTRSRATCRWSAAAGATARRATRCCSRAPRDATRVRRFALGDMPDADDLRRVYRALRDAGGIVDPDELVPCDRRPRSARSRRDARAGRHRAPRLRRGPRDARSSSLRLDGRAARVDELLDRYAREAESRVERIVAFAETRPLPALPGRRALRRDASRRPCGACDVCAPRGRSAALPTAADRRSRPTSPARSSRAVDGLTWPLGRSSLVAMLRGSVTAPPSARRSRVLRRSSRPPSDAEVKRWVKALERRAPSSRSRPTTASASCRPTHVALPDLQPALARPSAAGGAVGPDDPTSSASAPGEPSARSEDGVPAYVVLHDATLRELAAVQPEQRRPSWPP